MSSTKSQPHLFPDGASVIARLEQITADLESLLKAAPEQDLGRLAGIFSRTRQLLSEVYSLSLHSVARSDLRDVLTQILVIGKQIYKFDCGVIYFANQLHEELICLAEIGCRTGGGEPPTYKYSEPCFVGKVRETGKPQFSPNPLGDATVHPRGRAYFLFRTGLVGVPLKLDERVLGVLCVWGNTPPGPSEVEIGRLEPFAELAASYVALSIREDKFITVQRALNDILSQASTERNEIYARQTIMRGVLSFPFDRVRFFDYDRYSSSFMPLDCMGTMDRDRFLKVRVSSIHNPYAKHTRDTYKAQSKARLYRPDPGSCAVEQDSPCSPRNLVFRGPLDPDHDAIEKPGDLPWAVAPLVLGGELIGQLVADNLDNRWPITEDHLVFLNTMAALAVGVVANRRSVEFLSYKNLPDLYRWLASSHTRLAVIRRLLAFLTCGEALGFSRAVFFEWRGDQPRLVYRASVGSLQEEEFRRIGEATRFLPLNDVLRDAPDIEDYDIHEALSGYFIPLLKGDALDLVKGVMKVNVAPVLDHWTSGLAPLGKDGFLTAPLQADGRDLGLFLVDRKWQPNPHRDDLDTPALRTFAHLAAQALAQHDLRTNFARGEDEDKLASIAGFVNHTIIEQVHNLGLCVKPLERAITGADTTIALAKLDDIRSCLEHLNDSNLGLRSLVEMPNLCAVSLHTFFEEVCDQGEWGYRPEVDCPINLRIMGDEKQLHVCFDELIRNSQYWLNQCRKLSADRRIFITVSTPSVLAIPPALDPGEKYALIHFEDTGDGIDPEIFGRIFDLGVSGRPSSGTSEGWGVGLFQVRRIIRLHKGSIKVCGPSSDGAHFVIFLPLFSSRSQCSAVTITQ